MKDFGSRADVERALTELGRQLALRDADHMAVVCCGASALCVLGLLARRTLDIDAIGLANLVNRLNHGIDSGGNPIGRPTSFVIGVGVNPGAIDLEHELRRFQWKVEAGAEYAITQPVFDVNQLKYFLKRIEPFRIPIIPGIWPLTSYRNAEFLNNEVPGVSVPEPIMERMRRASDGAAALEEGVRIAQEMLEEVRPLVQGVQVSAPFGKIPHALDVFKILK